MIDRRRILAAITLDRAGGGVAGVSRLIWKVLQDEWGTAARSVELMRVPGPAGSRPGQASRIAFGLKLTALQLTGHDPWTIYSHLSPALVQEHVPVRLHRPYAIFLHGIEAWRTLSSAHRRVIERATLLIANSHFTARRMAEAHPWVGPIAVCPLALPESVTAAEPPRSRGRRPTAVIVGRLSSAERYKGHDQVLEAWPAVRLRVPDARLMVIGDGDDAPRLRGKAESLGLSGSVEFKGFLSDPDLAACYRESSVFVMPSLNEGFGLVYLEAMRQGLPCIGSIHDAAGDVIEDGVTGFLIDQRDLQGLAGRLVQFLDDRETAERMGAAGRARLDREFGYERFRTRLVGLLRGAFADVPTAAFSESVARERQ